MEAIDYCALALSIGFGMRIHDEIVQKGLLVAFAYWFAFSALVVITDLFGRLIN